MKLCKKDGLAPRGLQSGFTLVDVTFGIAISALLFMTLYLGFAQGFAVIQLARENLRATQILQEKMETTWLYTWDQINTPGFIPTSFQSSFYPAGPQSGKGIIYQGTMAVTDAPVAESYGGSLKQVVVQVNWVSGSVRRQRQMTTLVSRYGLHNYIY